MSFKVIKLADVETELVLEGSIREAISPKKTDSKHCMFVLGGPFKPGEGLELHAHPNSEEVYYVIKGRGTVYYGKERREVPIEPGIAIFIPPGAEHGVSNTGKEELIIAFFLAPPV